MQLFLSKSLSSQLSGSLSPHCSLFLVSGSIWISFWRPWRLENTTNSLRGSSFSSISKFSLRSPLRKEKMSQKGPPKTPKTLPKPTRSSPGEAKSSPWAPQKISKPSSNDQKKGLVSRKPRKWAKKHLQRHSKHHQSRPGAAQERPRVAHEHPRRYRKPSLNYQKKGWASRKPLEVFWGTSVLRFSTFEDRSHFIFPLICSFARISACETEPQVGGAGGRGEAFR